MKLVIALACCLLAALPACGDDGEARPETVVMSGVAYGFNTPDPVAGAEIRILEAPALVATTGPDGAWSLEVPAQSEVTPYITHADYVTMYLETFAVADADIEHVNFQSVTPEIYDLLAAVLQVTPDPAMCQIASTVSEKAIQDLSYEDFRAHGAHGVADATVTITPAAATVVYFNEQVIPDRTRTASSRDGGVVWTNVPPGRYVLRATHASKQFAEVTVTCAAGRFVNANPPHGIAEL